LFWTVPLRHEDEDDDGVTVDLADGEARMRATDLHVRDFFNLPNALLHLQKPVSVPATVSFDIRWLGPATNRMRVTKPRGSSGHVFKSPVTMTWSAANGSGFSFRSNPAHTTSFFGQLGHIRNGVFSG
jgi:hypothetical protein